MLYPVPYIFFLNLVSYILYRVSSILYPVGGRRTPLKRTVDTALEKCETVKTVLVMRRTGAEIKMKPNRFKTRLYCSI